MEQKVCIGDDLTVVITIANISHVLSGVPAIEVPANIQWAAWANSGAYHKLAQSVLHKNQPMAQGFHDCGRLILHVVTALDIPIGTAQSSRTCSFSAMDVQVESEPVGFGTSLNWPPTPMLTCGSVPLPVGDAITSGGNGVVVGMDPLWDYVASWVGIAAEMAVGLALCGLNAVITLTTMGAGGIVATLVKPGWSALASLGMNEAVRHSGVGQGVVEDIRSIRHSSDRAATVNDILRSRNPVTAPLPFTDSSAWELI